MEIEFFSLKGPYTTNILKYTDTTIVFDGYFRYEDELITKERPVHRFLRRRCNNNDDEILYIAIVGVRRGKDTSEYWSDEEAGGRICLTPTEIIELDYEVVETVETKGRYTELHRHMKEEETHYEELNDELYRLRRQREWGM